MSQQLEFTLDITCQACVPGVETALKSIDFAEYGLSKKKIDLTVKKLFIQFDQTKTRHTIDAVQNKIIQSISDGGIDCQLEAVKQRHPIHHWLLGGIGLVTGIALFAIPLFFGGALSFPLLLLFGLTSTLLTLGLGYQSYLNAYHHARYSGTMTMDTLFTISTLTIITVSIAALFLPGLPLMFEAGLMLFGFRHIGLGIEELLNRKSGVQQNFSKRVPAFVQLETGESVDLNTIKAEDVILLKSGSIIPVDGFFLDENIQIKNKILTGHDKLVTYRKNQSINAGAVLDSPSGSYRFMATACAQDSYLVQLDQMLLSAQQNKASVEYYTDRALQYFIPTVIAIAIVSGVIVGTLFSPAAAIQCAAAVLVTACPCTLGMIVPMTMKIGMQKGLKHGVIFQSREAIEKTRSITDVVFDLNGSLTQGKPEILKTRFATDVNPTDLWPIIYQIEANASHPVGKCLAEYAQKHLPDFESTEPPAATIRQLANGRELRLEETFPEPTIYLLGNRACLAAYEIKTPHPYKEACPTQYLARDGKIIAEFQIIDPLRSGAKQTVEELQRSGKSVYILTGADHATAAYYGNLLDIDDKHILANQRPEHKQNQIDKLQQNGKVAMVGDGDNDAIAVKTSDLGIAMRSQLSDSITEEQADVIISDQSLYPISHLFKIADQTMGILKQNLWLSVSYNMAALVLTGGLLVALGFAVNPAIGAGLMVLQTSLILLNTYRLTRQSVSTSNTSEPMATGRPNHLRQLWWQPASDLSPTHDVINTFSGTEPEALPPQMQTTLEAEARRPSC